MKTTSPNQMKFVTIAVVALILGVAGAVFTSQEQPNNVEARVNPKDGLKYVWIQPGTFMMGCSTGDTQCTDDEKPPHQVAITKGFWLGQTEVTVGAYKRFVSATVRQMPPEPKDIGRPLNPGWSDETMPIVDVTWDDANAYCGWAGGRLPTEAEWEYAARGGTTEARYGHLDEIAWSADNSGRERLDSTAIWREGSDYKQRYKIYSRRVKENGNNMHAVGQKRANAFGLYDTLGNVWEWVNDWYDAKYYMNSPSQDPSGQATGKMRVVRGGSWAVLPMLDRVSFRENRDASGRFIDIGFRCGGQVFPQ